MDARITFKCSQVRISFAIEHSDAALGQFQIVHPNINNIPQEVHQGQLV